MIERILLIERILSIERILLIETILTYSVGWSIADYKAKLSPAKLRCCWNLAELGNMNSEQGKRGNKAGKKQMDMKNKDELVYD